MEMWQNYIPNPKDGWTQQRLLAGGNPRFTSNYTPGPGPAAAGENISGWETGIKDAWNKAKNWGKTKAGPQAQKFAKGFGRTPLGQSFSGFGGAGKSITPLRAGNFAGRALPYLPVATNVLEGDVEGAVASGIGSFIGGKLAGRLAGAALGAKAGPWGALAGGILGEPLIKGGVRAAGRLAGSAIGLGDPSDPLSGREGLRLFGKPMSQIEKTKQRMERQSMLREQYIMPMMEEIQNNQHKRTMEMASLGMMQNMMSSTNQMMAQLYR